jgi:two-component sensor histidine kinase
LGGGAEWLQNNLQVITSIISLQASKKDTSSILQETENRIAAIALAYEKLTFPDKSDKVALKPYLETLMHQLLEDKRIKLQKILHTPELFIDIHQAVTLGLIIAECHSNTLKYAFPMPVEEALFRVNLEVQEKTLLVTISDNGQGFLEKDEKNGTGLEIISSLCKNRFKTQPSFCNQQGATIRLSIEGCIHQTSFDTQRIVSH